MAAKFNSDTEDNCSDVDNNLSNVAGRGLNNKIVIIKALFISYKCSTDT